MGYIVKCVAGRDLSPYEDYFGKDKQYNSNRTVFICHPDSDALRYFKRNQKKETAREIESSCENPIVLTSSDPLFRAVKISRDLFAEECIIYTRSGGVFTSGDRAKGKLIERLDYDEALEMLAGGYDFLRADIVEFAKRNGVEIKLVPFQGNCSGTVIKEVLSVNGGIIKGVIKDPDVCIVSLADIPDIVGISYRIFKIVSEADITVDIISLPASGKGKQDISFTVRRKDRRKTERVLKENQQNLGFSRLSINDNVTKVSVVGSDLRSGKGIAAAMFKVLYENNISLRLINTSEIKISVIIDRQDANLAVMKIHENFIDDKDKESKC